jgi:hypothetical protein
MYIDINGIEERLNLQHWAGEELRKGNRNKAARIKKVLDRWLIRIGKPDMVR